MNVEQPALWLSAGSRKGMMEKAGLYGQSRNCQGFGLKGQEDRIPRGNWDVNEAGISLKINEMRKCHPHQGFWRRGEVGDFASRDAGKANPRGLTNAVAIRYKDSDPSEPKAVIFRGIYRLQLELARFSLNLNADRPSDQGFVLGILRCSLPSLDETDRRKVTSRRSAAWGGRRAPRKARAGRQCNDRGTRFTISNPSCY